MRGLGVPIAGISNLVIPPPGKVWVILSHKGEGRIEHGSVTSGTQFIPAERRITYAPYNSAGKQTILFRNSRAVGLRASSLVPYKALRADDLIAYSGFEFDLIEE